MNIFCKHNWKILSEQLIESPAKATGMSTCKNADISIFMSTHIQIVTCDKCGKIKRYSEKV